MRISIVALTLLFFLGCSQSAFGQDGPFDPVHLEWRPESQTVNVGDTVRIGYYAVSSTNDELSVSDIEAALLWDPTVLQLVGRDNNGPYRWFVSGFTTQFLFDPQRLNDTWNDGNAQYLAARQLNPSAAFYAPPEGRLITTLIFRALAETPQTTLMTPSEFVIDPEVVPNHSRVFHGLIPGVDITGNLGSATIRIVPEPATAMLLLIGAGSLIRLSRRRGL